MISEAYSAEELPQQPSRRDASEEAAAPFPLCELPDAALVRVASFLSVPRLLALHGACRTLHCADIPLDAARLLGCEPPVEGSWGSRGDTAELGLAFEAARSANVAALDRLRAERQRGSAPEVIARAAEAAGLADSALGRAASAMRPLPPTKSAAAGSALRARSAALAGTSAREMAVAWGDDARYWSLGRAAQAGSRFDYAETRILRSVWWLALSGELRVRGSGTHHVLLRTLLLPGSRGGTWTRVLEPAPEAAAAGAGAAVAHAGAGNGSAAAAVLSCEQPQPPLLGTHDMPRGVWLWVWLGAATLRKGAAEAAARWSVADTGGTHKAGLLVALALAVHEDDLSADGAAAEAVRTRLWGASGIEADRVRAAAAAAAADAAAHAPAVAPAPVAMAQSLLRAAFSALPRVRFG